MQLAANIGMLFKDQPLLERIATAKQLGFQGVELAQPYTHSTSEWQQALAQQELPLVLINLPTGDFQQGGLGLACHPDRSEAFQQALETALPYIEALQPGIVNVLAGRQPPEHEWEACQEQLLRSLEQVCQRLAGLQVKITCEPINTLDQPGYFIPRADDWQTLADALNQPAFGLQLDLYHAARMQEDLDSLITRYLDQIVHVQFADCPGRSHPGTGTLPLEKLFGQLQQSGYSGWLAAEFSASSLENFDWIPHIHGISR